MLAVTVAIIVHSEVPILYDAFEHFEWYLDNDATNVSFRLLNRSRLTYVDFGLHVIPKKKV